MKIIKPDGGELVLPVDPSDEEAGVYVANYWPGEEGAYRVAVNAMGPDGSEIGSCQSGWATETATAEFQRIDPNREFLERVARDSGGETVLQDDLLEFAKDLPNKKVPITETWVHPYLAWTLDAGFRIGMPMW